MVGHCTPDTIPAWAPSIESIIHIGKKKLRENRNNLVGCEAWTGSWLTNLTFVFGNGEKVLQL